LNKGKPLVVAVVSGYSPAARQLHPLATVSVDLSRE
jgi:hypothetical protein